MTTRFSSDMLYVKTTATPVLGFTALCEKYSLDTKNGTDQLTKTLNEYMSALVGEIIDNDGDIIKFAGIIIRCHGLLGGFQ